MITRRQRDIVLSRIFIVLQGLDDGGIEAMKFARALHAVSDAVLAALGVNVVDEEQL